jgi:hypothetical protein
MHNLLCNWSDHVSSRILSLLQPLHGFSRGKECLNNHKETTRRGNLASACIRLPAWELATRIRGGVFNSREHKEAVADVESTTARGVNKIKLDVRGGCFFQRH